MTKIAVAGGTGVVGRHVVEEVRRRGHDAVVIARSTGLANPLHDHRRRW